MNLWKLEGKSKLRGRNTGTKLWSFVEGLRSTLKRIKLLIYPLSFWNLVWIMFSKVQEQRRRRSKLMLTKRLLFPKYKNFLMKISLAMLSPTSTKRIPLSSTLVRRIRATKLMKLCFLQKGIWGSGLIDRMTFGRIVPKVKQQKTI